jgi:hypothetical protein
VRDSEECSGLGEFACDAEAEGVAETDGVERNEFKLLLLLVLLLVLLLLLTLLSYWMRDAEPVEGNNCGSADEDCETGVNGSTGCTLELLCVRDSDADAEAGVCGERGRDELVGRESGSDMADQYDSIDGNSSELDDVNLTFKQRRCNMVNN